MPESRPAIGVLISGRGSNLQALIDAIDQGKLLAAIAVVIANRPGAGGLERARAAGIETLVIEHRAFPNRDAFDQVLASELLARRVSLVCLAGFMRLIGTPLLEAFPNRILNVHPSLLPSFPGVDAQRQALVRQYLVEGVATGERAMLDYQRLNAGRSSAFEPAGGRPIRDDNGDCRRQLPLIDSVDERLQVAASPGDKDADRGRRFRHTPRLRRRREYRRCARHPARQPRPAPR